MLKNVRCHRRALSASMTLWIATSGLTHVMAHIDCVVMSTAHIRSPSWRNRPRTLFEQLSELSVTMKRLQIVLVGILAFAGSFGSHSIWSSVFKRASTRSALPTALSAFVGICFSSGSEDPRLRGGGELLTIRGCLIGSDARPLKIRRVTQIVVSVRDRLFVPIRCAQIVDNSFV